MAGIFKHGVDVSKLGAFDLFVVNDIVCVDDMIKENQCKTNAYKKMPIRDVKLTLLQENQLIFIILPIDFSKEEDSVLTLTQTQTIQQGQPGTRCPNQFAVFASINNVYKAILTGIFCRFYCSFDSQIKKAFKKVSLHKGFCLLYSNQLLVLLCN